MSSDTEHRGKPLSQGLIDQIRRLHLERLTIRGISRITGVAKSTAERYIKGLPRHQAATSGPMKKMDSWPADETPSGDDEAEIDQLLGDYDKDPHAQ
jgi:hypothetical protein